MSVLHTVNGKPVEAANLSAETLALIDSYDWDGSKMIHDDAIEVVAVTLKAYRAALAEAVAMIDAERAGTKSGWSHDDRVKLERLRELAK